MDNSRKKYNIERFEIIEDGFYKIVIWDVFYNDTVVLKIKEEEQTKEILERIKGIYYSDNHYVDFGSDNYDFIKEVLNKYR